MIPVDLSPPVQEYQDLGRFRLPGEAKRLRFAVSFFCFCCGWCVACDEMGLVEVDLLVDLGLAGLAGTVDEGAGAGTVDEGAGAGTAVAAVTTADASFPAEVQA